VTGAWGPLGGTFAFARDDKNTSITFGPAEGFGFFGSIGQGAAASETSAQATVQGGLGPAGASVSAGTAGVTGTFSTAVPIQPGLNQTQTYTGTIDSAGNVTTSRTEGMGFGFNVGLVSSQTLSLSVSNETLTAIGNFFSAIGNALSGPPAPSAPGSEIGGPIPTD
jgi:hypothetical protein